MVVLDYELKPDIEDAARDFVVSSIRRSYATSQIEIAGDTLTVGFDEEVSPETFSGLMKRLLYISRSIDKDLLFENRGGHPCNQDPMPDLLDSGDVVKVADGAYMYQGEFRRVLQGLHDYVQRLAAKYKAIEQEYPPLWPIDLFRTINYLNEFPQQAMLVTTVGRRFKDREDFARAYEKGRDYATVRLTDHLEDCAHGLQPSVCDVCYYTLRNAVDQPNTIFTAYGPVFRNETSPTDSLDRLTVFSMREIMFVGDADFVATTRQRLIEDAGELLTLLDLDSRIETANDPFFTNDAAMKTVFQNASHLKYEMLARLNHCGEYLAVGSINLHLDVFGRAFNIRLPDGTFAHSGCIGIGFERLAFALCCQYGPYPSTWPAALRKNLELPEAS